jgi:hypothetical protein
MLFVLVEIQEEPARKRLGKFQGTGDDNLLGMTQGPYFPAEGPQLRDVRVLAKHDRFKQDQKQSMGY